jgi:hypothetical protein
MNNMITYAIGIVSIYIGSIYTCFENVILLILGHFNCRLCTSKNKKQYNIIKNLSPYSTLIDIDGPTAWVIDRDWKFVAYIYHTNGEYIMQILSGEAFLIKHDFIDLVIKEIVEEEPDKTLKIWERDGTYHWLRYSCRSVNFETKALPHQQPIIDDICDYSKEHLNTVVLLHGEPGTGKSMIPMLVAMRIHGSYVTSFDPCDPGDTLVNLVTRTKPTKDKKLVIVFEEVDGMIDNICNNKVVSHKNIPTLVKNKRDWNTLFDNIGSGFYENIILIMTTNIDPDMIANGDSSFLRKGRVNMKVHITGAVDDVTTDDVTTDITDNDSTDDEIKKNI